MKERKGSEVNVNGKEDNDEEKIVGLKRIKQKMRVDGKIEQIDERERMGEGKEKIRKGKEDGIC